MEANLSVRDLSQASPKPGWVSLSPNPLPTERKIASWTNPGRNSRETGERASEIHEPTIQPLILLKTRHSRKDILLTMMVTLASPISVVRAESQRPNSSGVGAPRRASAVAPVALHSLRSSNLVMQRRTIMSGRRGKRKHGMSHFQTGRSRWVLPWAR